MSQPEADRLVQAAAAAMTVGQLGQAAQLLDRALVADPSHAMALTKQAELAIFRKDSAGALRLTEAALAVEPNFAPAWHMRASALWGLGRQTDALEAARRAVDIQPPNPEYRLRLAQFAAWTGGGAEARAVLRPILEPDQPESGYYAAAIAMLGELAIAEGRFEEALPQLNRALEIEPKLEATRMLRGMTLLRLGRFQEGWIDYAARERIRQLYPDAAVPMANKVWRGENLTGKTLLVTDDQGHGDAIQFFRYVSMLRERGAASITWRTFSPLVRLLAGSAPDVNVVAAVPAGACFDFESNSTRLPGVIGTTLKTIPAPVPYLPPPSRVLGPVKRPTGQRARVGLAWSGDPNHTRDHLRSIPAALFLTLTAVPGLSFHSLQHQVRPSDHPAVEAHPTIGREVEKSVDFADTAALIDRLDLVITVDTAIAHLAGAMGKPVWLILHLVPDWRWLVDRPDSPWYPETRLFRVSRDESRIGWGPVIDRVATELRAFAGQRKG
jgi:tetratricopeptide (TPR) repeat protein